MMIISPLNERDYKRFGIEVLIENGFDVLIFDLSKLLFSLNNTKKYEDLVTPISSYIDLEKKINEIKFDSVFIPFFGISSKTIRVTYMLSRLNATTVEYNTNIIPITFQSISFINKLKINIKSLTPSSLISKLNYIYITRLKSLRAPDYAILGGSKSDRFSEENTKKIWTHTLDYDIFLEVDQQLERIVDEKYCVYLDDYIPYHPDNKKVGLENTFKNIADSYYSKMNSFFDYIEKMYNLKIVIAAHPRAEYNKIGNVWQGREIYYNKSICLIKYADFCMMHASTSINFPVLYNKPIIFLTLDELNPLYGFIIDGFSRAVGAKKLFIENRLKKQEFDLKLEVDIQMYENYKESYIKKNNTINKNSWQIFVDYIKEENVIKK